MSASITLRTFIAASPETVFDLELDVAAHKESLSFSCETVIGSHSQHLKMGDLITWRARHLLVHWTMTVRICDYDRPRSFVDEQVSGPFSHFRHVHRFDAHGEGGTEMTDEILFRLPFGFLGWFAERIVLARYLARIIAVRNEYLKREAERNRTDR